ncbi:MAG: SecY-interacting protein Syd [Pseudomonadales bacterium]|nr:SecY-interacting protein Syd [Pseudomonadales bacterium]
MARCRAAGPLTTEHDPAWPSPCEIGAPDANGLVHWQPVLRDDYDLLGPLEETLGVAIHPSVVSFYGRWFSDGFRTVAREGEVNLIGVWNEDDTLRLQQNLLGHALQQQRRRQPLTFFFALTEEASEAVLSVDNARGAVVLEVPGTDRREDVSATLASFLRELSPR